jgi:hypothetical protein
VKCWEVEQRKRPDFEARLYHRNKCIVDATRIEHAIETRDLVTFVACNAESRWLVVPQKAIVFVVAN